MAPATGPNLAPLSALSIECRGPERGAGELIVRLPEDIRSEIKAIKNGKFKRDEFLNWIADEDKRIFELADKSKLPDGPDRKTAERIVISIYKDVFSSFSRNF